jgi:hypothetical protein
MPASLGSPEKNRDGFHPFQAAPMGVFSVKHFDTDGLLKAERDVFSYQLIFFDADDAGIEISDDLLNDAGPALLNLDPAVGRARVCVC